SILSPRVVNNFIGAVNYYQALFSPANVPASVAAFPVNLNIADGGANGTGGVSSLRFSNPAFPPGRRAGQTQVVDDVSYTKGRHNMKFGFNYRYDRVSDLTNEELTVGGQYTLVGLDEFSS